MLKEALTDASRVAILGCGSPFRGDDAAGSRIAELLGDLRGRARAFVGGTAPENLTGEIKRYNPDLILVIDAVDMSLPPGETQLILSEEIGGVTFSTHILPLSIIMDYLASEIGCKVFLLGIQVKSLEFMTDPSPLVAQAIDTIAAELREILA